jgi:hypothetical protein
MNEWEKGPTEGKAESLGAGRRAMAVIAAGACIGVAVIVIVLSFLSES